MRSAAAKVLMAPPPEKDKAQRPIMSAGTQHHATSSQIWFAADCGYCHLAVRRHEGRARPLSTLHLGNEILIREGTMRDVVELEAAFVELFKDLKTRTLLNLQDAKIDIAEGMKCTVYTRSAKPNSDFVLRARGVSA